MSVYIKSKFSYSIPIIYCLCLLQTKDGNATGLNNAMPSINTRATNTKGGKGLLQ